MKEMKIEITKTDKGHLSLVHILVKLVLKKLL